MDIITHHHQSVPVQSWLWLPVYTDSYLTQWLPLQWRLSLPWLHTLISHSSTLTVKYTKPNFVSHLLELTTYHNCLLFSQTTKFWHVQMALLMRSLAQSDSVRSSEQHNCMHRQLSANNHPKDLAMCSTSYLKSSGQNVCACTHTIYQSNAGKKKSLI